MQLVVMRHGIAVDRSEGLPDRERPLTSKGRARTRTISQWLNTRWHRWDSVLSSPFVRASQTADILQAVGLVTDVEIFQPLAPGGAFADLVMWGSTQPSLKTVAIVGHQPDLGDWIELAVWGQASGRIQLKKAGVAIVDFPSGQMRIGRGILCEVLSPKAMLSKKIP